MKLNNIILTRAIRFLDGPATASGVYLPKVIAMMRDNFGFLGVPTNLEGYDFSKGMKFSHGTYRNNVIDTLEIFNDGIVITTKTDASFNDEVIDSVIELAVRELNYSVRPLPHKKRMYVSEVDVILERDFRDSFKKFERAYNVINRALAQQSDGIQPFEMSGIFFNYDMVHSPHLKPMGFLLDRKINTSSDVRLFYSKAPLPTEAHLVAIQEIENAL